MNSSRGPYNNEGPQKSGLGMKNLLFLSLLATSFVIWSDEGLFSDSATQDVSKRTPHSDAAFLDDSAFDELPLETVGAEFEDDFASLETSPGSSPEVAVVSRSVRLYDPLTPSQNENSVALFGGNETIASMYHFTLFPQGRFTIGPTATHLGLPLRFPIYDNDGSKKSGSYRGQGFVKLKQSVVPRQGDFRQWWDAQRLIRRFSVGAEDGPYQVVLARDSALTLGQGVLVKDMRPNYFFDHDHLFADAFVAFNKVRVDAILGPIPKINIMAVNARVAPFDTMSAPGFFREANLDFTYAIDANAPNQLRRSESGALLMDDERRLVKRDTGVSQGFAVTALSETFPVSWLSLKPYLSYGHLFVSGLKEKESHVDTKYGAGVHLGNDLAIFFSGEPHSMLFLRTEGRIFSQKYIPSYFGSTYMLDRVNMMEPGRDGDGTSKSQYLGTGPQGFRLGYMTEIGYEYRDVFSTALGYENARIIETSQMVVPMRHLRFAMSLIPIERFTLIASYEAAALKEMKDIFDFRASRGLVSLKGQVRILPFLYFESSVNNSFGVKDMYEESGEWLTDLGATRATDFGVGLSLVHKF